MCVWAGEGKKREELKRRRSVFGVGGVRLMIEGRGQKAIFRGEEEKEKKKEEEEEECVYKSKEGRKERIAREEGEGAKEMGGKKEDFGKNVGKGAFTIKLNFVRGAYVRRILSESTGCTDFGAGEKFPDSCANCRIPYHYGWRQRREKEEGEVRRLLSSPFSRRRRPPADEEREKRKRTSSTFPLVFSFHSFSLPRAAAAEEDK